MVRPATQLGSRRPAEKQKEEVKAGAGVSYSTEFHQAVQQYRPQRQWVCSEIARAPAAQIAMSDLCTMSTNVSQHGLR